MTAGDGNEIFIAVHIAHLPGRRVHFAEKTRPSGQFVDAIDLEVNREMENLFLKSVTGRWGGLNEIFMHERYLKFTQVDGCDIVLFGYYFYPVNA